MQVFKGLDSVVKDSNSILTVGTFDGVHLGHKYILNELTNGAKLNSCSSSLVTFDPHPKLVLEKYGGDNKKVLTTLDEKLELLNNFGIERVVVVEFTKDFANIRSEDFIEKVLYQKIGFSEVLIGYDHAFGKDREGSVSVLNKFSNKLGFKVRELSEFTDDRDLNYKSSNIRSLLRNGDVVQAAKLLGRPYSLSGCVIHGEGRGKDLAYPTANLLQMKDKLVPGTGVYAVTVEVDCCKYQGMMNIGIRPTFGAGKSETLEVHLFDFEQNIYGETVRINFVNKIRDEQKFKNSNELISQLNKDKIRALNDLNILKEA